MLVGIMGLGVIGASFAKAVKLKTEHKVLGFDKDNDINIKAKILKVVDDKLGFDNIGECDVLLLALPLEETKEFIRDHSARLGGCKVVVDCCGVKRGVCAEGFKEAERNGFTFVGINPMTECSEAGFDASRPSLFDGVSVAMTPSYDASIQVLDMLKKLFTRIGFSNIEICSPQEHDRIIAFTSQLSHVIASAYMKSPTASEHYGLSPQIYDNISKAAIVDEKLWANLLLENRENIENEIDYFISELQKYQNSLRDGDLTSMVNLLKEGREKKEYIDNKNDILRK